jgi:hypothetical protein
MMTISSVVLVITTKISGCLYLEYLTDIPDPTSGDIWTTFEEYKAYRYRLRDLKKKQIEEANKQIEEANKWDVYDQYEHGTYEVKEQENSSSNLDSKKEDAVTSKESSQEQENSSSNLDSKKEDAVTSKESSQEQENSSSNFDSKKEDAVTFKESFLEQENNSLNSEESSLDLIKLIIKFLKDLIDFWMP